MRTQGTWFIDDKNRKLILRGVNLGGSSKVPCRPDGATHLRGAGLFEHRDVSFVGRPFPLDEADEHFSRLAAWGFNFLRLVVTWEALEHAGPGQYDSDYLDYLEALLLRADAHKLAVYIDPHQDVWSRFTGGDGAPGWTLAAVGLDMRRLHEAGAAFLHQLHDEPLSELGMIWPTNAIKLGAATMFTLFFGGSDFAPLTRIDGEPAQEYLQRHYVEALCLLAKRLSRLPSVVGFGSMNEPMPGFIGLPLDGIPAGMLKKGPSPTPFQSMLLGAGHPQKVEIWEMSRQRVGLLGHKVVNASGVSVWLPEHPDIWKLHGVYTDEGGPPRLLRSDYFTRHPRHGSAVQFERDFLQPFCLRVLRALRSVDTKTLFFVEGTPAPLGQPPPLQPEDCDLAGVIHAPHWYDGMTLLTKHYDRELCLDLVDMMPVLGRAEVRASYGRQLAHLKKQLPHLPALLGEFGLNFDLDNGKSYKSGDYSDQLDALDAYYSAIEENLLSSTQWNYTSNNNNEHGDNWNGEDLSIYSRDQRTAGAADLHDGGRALLAIVRPYARATFGEPLRMSYDRQSRVFVFLFRDEPSSASRASCASRAPTEIFVPDYPYPNGVIVEVSDGSYQLDALPGTLRYHPSDSRLEHQIVLRPADGNGSPGKASR